MARRRRQCSLPTLGLRSHGCLHTCWRGRSMGQIFEHREAAAGVRRLPRTVGENVGERWRDGADSAVCRPLGLRSHGCLHTCWGGRSMGQIFDHRETVMGQCRLSRTVLESVGERWRDGAGSSPTLGINHKVASSLRGTDAADFRLSRNGDGSCAGWRAQYASVSGSDGATAQAECLPWVSGHTDACTHVCAGSCRDRFSTVEKR